MNLPKIIARVGLGRFLGALGTFGVTVLLARGLSTESVGLVFLIVATMTFVGRISDLGILDGMMKRLSEGQSEKEVFGGVLLMKFITLGITSILLGLSEPFVAHYISTEIYPYIYVLLWLHEIYVAINRALSGVHRIGETAELQTAKPLIWLILAAFSIQQGYGFTGVITGLMVAYSIVILWGGIKLRPKIDIPTLDIIRSLFNYSKHVYISNIGGMAYQWSDVFFIGLFLGASWVGIYEIAWRLTSPILLLSGSIAMTLFPEMSEWSANNSEEKIEKVVKDGIFAGGLISIPAFFGAALYGRPILETVFGEEYGVASLVLIILMAETVLQAFHMIIGRTLQAIDEPYFGARAAVISIFVNIVLNIILIPMFGIVGAAIATAISFSVNTFLHIAYAQRFLKIEIPYKRLFRVCLASIAMSIGIVFLRNAQTDPALWTVALTIIIATIIYIGTLLSFQDMRYDIQRVLSLK